MSSVKHKNLKRLAVCLGAMGVTCAVMLLLMLFFGLKPYGNASLAAADCKIQYLDFFNYYKDVLNGDNRIGYSLTKGLGGNGVGLFSYYLASPLNLIMYFFDGTQTNTVIDILIFIKLALAAGTFAYFLQARLYDRLSPFFTILLSVGYGLTHYAFSNCSNVMWLDGMFLLPLMLLGTHLVVRRRSLFPLALPTALCIFSNWYTGGINCLFCIIWLVFEFFLNEIDPESGDLVPQSDAFGADVRGPGLRVLLGFLERFLGTVVRYGAAMVLGIAISAVLFLPTISSLQLGRGSAFYFDTGMVNHINGNMWNTIAQYRTDGASTVSYVSLYSGSLAAIGTFAFFLSRRVRIRRKIIAAGLLAVTILTYYWQPMVFTFSLFKAVFSYYSRYGYTGALVLLLLAGEYLRHVFPSRIAAAEEKAQNGELKKTEYFLPIFCSVLFCALLFTVGDHPTLETRGAWETSLFMLGAGICTSALLAVRHADSAGRRRFVTAVASVLLLAISMGELFRSGEEVIKYNRLKDVEAYSNYVTESKEQVKLLKEYDSDYYRISQIGWRELDKKWHTATYNDSLAYNYMGIGGYTSSPENDQMYLLQRLGYKEDNQTMNIVNTSFVPADSMLGVRYVFSITDVPGMQKIEELGKYCDRETYYNPYALPLAFVYDGSMLPDHEYHNPFEYLEEIWTALSGEEAHIFKALETEKAVSGDTITWTAKVPTGNVALYGNLPTDENNRVESTLQAGTDPEIGYSQWLGPTVFSIPFNKGDSTVKITVTSKKEFVPTEEQFYAVDLDRLQELSDKISKGAEQVSDLYMDNGTMSCTVNAKEGEKLFMIIPRTMGWNTYVNGEKIPAEEFAYCLTVIPLSEGENKIERFYRVPNKRRGIAVTAAGLVFLAAYEIFIRRKRKVRK